MRGLLRRWQTEQGDASVVSFVRMIFGAFLVLNALRELSELEAGTYFGDFFHVPMVPEVLVPSRTAFALLVTAQLVLGGLVLVGRFARPALLASALIGLYLLFCDRVSYHNNRYALMLFAFVLAFAPCDRAWVFRWRRSGDRAPPSRSPFPSSPSGPLWAQRLAQLQLSVIYVASSGAKLLDPDWRGGLVLHDRLIRHAHLAIAKGVPGAVIEFFAREDVASSLAKLAIASELGLAVFLFVPRVRPFALWWGTMFHLTIELTSNVELFSFLSLAVYGLFAIPTTRERAILFDPSHVLSSFLARGVRALDWLARFELRPRPKELDGHAFAVVDRDGSIAYGGAAFARVTRALPLLFPLSMPLLALTGYSFARKEPIQRVG